MNTLPSIFVSHGSPMTALEPGRTGAFWRQLGAAIDSTFGRPRTVLAVSAHSLTRQPVLFGAEQHEAVHDFSGFPQALYDLRYDVRGAPGVAAQAAMLMLEAGITPAVAQQGGLDHGIWTPLRWMWPQGGVQVVPLAYVPTQSPAGQFALGQALAPLADQGVLVMGSGSITHNLRLLGRFVGQANDEATPERPDSAAFRAWFAERAAASDWPALFDYRRAAPHAAEMHPTDEHLLPFYVAAGAGDPETRGLRLHDEVVFGALGMDAYAFGPAAQQLADALAA